MTCEVELPSRSKNAEPVPCGKAATAYRMSGGIAWVYTKLCGFHAEKMKLRGYTLEKVAPEDQERSLRRDGEDRLRERGAKEL